jgi:hypothetical protein
MINPQALSNSYEVIIWTFLHILSVWKDTYFYEANRKTYRAYRVRNLKPGVVMHTYSASTIREDEAWGSYVCGQPAT